MSWRLSDLAARIGASLIGDGDVEITRVRALEQAGEGELSFCLKPAYRKLAEASGASALLVPPSLTRELRGNNLLVVAETEVALATILDLLHPPTRPAPGIHPTAVIADDVELGEGVHVGPYAVVGAGTILGDEVVLEAHVVVGEACRLGARARLHPHVVLYAGTVLGAGVVVHSGAVLGADGFGYASRRDGVHVKLPHVGITRIGDDVEIGANSAVDRAALEETRVGAGTKIDNLVQVGHNVVIGRGCIVCGQVGIGGSAEIDDYVVLGGQVGVIDHVPVGSGARVAATSAIMGAIGAGEWSGTPAIPIKEWRRQVVANRKAADLGRRVRALEKRLETLDAQSNPGDESE